MIYKHFNFSQSKERTCAWASKGTNTQMFTFRTNTVNFNLFELLMKDLQAFIYQPIKFKRMHIGAVLFTKQ
jgi:hypothetical protein